ncbi:uncharacterized protein [Montipora capricornis]|uniref:uncharacterized protein n=1 Tax=Montipora capricornis TaxID=246305 RepID=UPI0035F1F4D6
MASTVLNYLGRFLIVVLTLTQLVFFVAYPLVVNYRFASLIVVVAILICYFVGTIMMLVAFSMFSHAYGDTDGLRSSTLIWTGYVAIYLVPNIVITFGFVVDALEEDGFLWYRVLKRVLCITPFILLLLILISTKAADSFERYRKQMWYLSFQMVIELFDISEMLSIVLDAKQQKYGISHVHEFGVAVTTVACFAYLITPLQMEETIFVGGEIKTRYKTTLVRHVLQMIGVNLLFLIFRLTLEHGKDSSISIGISKNVLGMLYSMWTIIDLCKRNPHDN